jgi:hypothetical protein
MIYLLINKKTNKIRKINNKPFGFYNDILFCCEVESLPEQKYDYLLAENIREVTNTYTETIEEVNDSGEVITKEVEKIRTYLTCDLVAKFNPQPSQEQLEKLKEEKYNARVTQLIRLKYSADAVEALLANYAEDKEKYQAEFAAFAAYRKQCKEQAHNEIYGG